MISTSPDTITTWQAEQLDALRMVRCHLTRTGSESRERLRASVVDYLSFRRDLDAFLAVHFSHVCTRSCYANNKSACCGKDGIITFFAEVVINALVSAEEELDLLMDVLKQPNKGLKCVYLGAQGCLWHLRPVMCALFLCDPAEAEVFHSNAHLRSQWSFFKDRERAFKWPDRAVLFDDMEKLFITAGYRSALMYCHTSPGLLRVKRSAGLNPGVSQGGNRSGHPF
ncbi:MAG: hypothetical protein U9Q05_02265 [Thermodesulfobacteriota bacterium]|nr:hypothetical protein [Thermodesulfobacteriota bacterium]